MPSWRGKRLWELCTSTLEIDNFLLCLTRDFVFIPYREDERLWSVDGYRNQTSEDII